MRGGMNEEAIIMVFGNGFSYHHGSYMIRT